MTVEIDRENSTATFIVDGPKSPAPRTVEEVHSIGTDFWPLAMARELEDAILHLRFNEETLRTWIFRTRGDPALLKSHDALLAANADD